MYRNLTPKETERLEQQGCSAKDWTLVQIDADTDLGCIRDVRFSGNCRLGKFQRTFTMPGGMEKHAGVYRATLHDTTIGDDCCIENVRNYIANYDIEDNCFIENVDVILTDGPTTFGNGVEVAVLNETGGREVPIHDHLTAHEAYMVAMYRHRPRLIQRFREMTTAYAESKKSCRGTIASHATIVGTSYIKNVCVGAYAKIEGTGRLKNGTIVSREESPVHIGYGVIADDFIVQDGSSIEDGTTLSRCYVGQACTLGHGYSASDSLFFCNCQEENGEACAIFAGPFTVTHHKSTLLIAGIFSFMNAGSGSNQSNHMYKLGPIHQGAMERGSKTSSDSYILWPARIGAFSLVMGRHTTNPDTSDMPFSYLIEKKGVTYLAPAVNLRSVGTVRDAQKWPKRDKRHPEGRLDQINFNLLSPYTIQKMVKGRDILLHLKKLSGDTSDTYSYQSARITSQALHRGIQLYDIAIRKFLGNSLITRLAEVQGDITRLAPETDIQGEGDWVDLAGLLAPHTVVSQMMDDIEEGKLGTTEDINQRLQSIHAQYYQLEWKWAWQLMLQYYGLTPETLNQEAVIRIIRQWKEAVVGLDHMLYEDARKEFSMSSRTGFGIDGRKEETAQDDFEQVRGDFESNTFVQAVLEHITRKTALGDKWLELLK